MKNFFCAFAAFLLLAACQNPQKSAYQCGNALIAYAERFPEAQPQDIYKLVFQDLYGPGHLLTDSVAALRYIGREMEEMPDSTAFPLYEYTLCDSHFVRVNLLAVKHGKLTVERLVSAVLRSAEGMPTPAPRFVLSHSPQFKQAYHPHYRIIRRDIFERDILPHL